MNIVYAILPVISLIAGFYMGYTIKTENKLPEIKTPAEIIEEKKEVKKEKEEAKTLQQYLENIDNYPNNQKEFK